MIKRQYNPSYVTQYTVVKSGYEAGRDRLYVAIQVQVGLSELALLATLEDALLANYQQRTQPSHEVKIEAYYNYPISEAGSVRWGPDTAPKYKVEKRKDRDRDVAVDVLLELLKGAK